jgi:hypothetical protein
LRTKAPEVDVRSPRYSDDADLGLAKEIDEADR